MVALNLETKGKEQELIKEYLERTASEELAKKINYGTSVNKDGRELINKKTLDGFMCYALDEARKHSEKGATGACIEDKIVYGWVMHYFEEDSIVGTLYDGNGQEYKPVKEKPKTTAIATSKPTVPETPTKPQNEQTSFLDMLSAKSEGNGVNSSISPVQQQNSDEATEKTEKPVTPDISPVQTQKQGTPFYQSYLRLQTKYKDCILWLRLGDFYEALGESAKVAAEVLDLTLTGRDCGLEERVPMCGVPYHAADVYFERLITKGYKVAVAEDYKEESVSVLDDKFVTDENGQKVDIETGEILNDEDKEEPEELPTVSEITKDLVDNDTDYDAELKYERELAKAFDKEVLIIISDLFKGEFTIA